MGPGWWLASDGKWYPPQAPPAAPPPPPPPEVQSSPSLAPSSAPVQPRTNGFAVASLVLSVLWIAGLGSGLAVIFAVIARRRIRDSRGTESGDGLAIAGLTIGLVGLFGAVLFWALAAAIGSGVHSAYKQINNDLTPKTIILHYGQTAHLSPDAVDLQLGVTSITVRSLAIPAPAQPPLPADAGKEFAVALIQMCAGPGGVQGRLDPLGFNLFFPGGQTVDPTPNEVEPGLDEINALGAGQCGSGYVTFEIAKGSTPSGVEYQTGLPNRAYRWAP